MNNHNSSVKFLSSSLLLAILAFVFLAPVEALSQAQHQTDRERAIALYESSKLVDALPLLEKAAAVNPKDPIILSRLGFALYATSATEKDPALRQKIRERARKILLQSQSLGDNSNLTQITLDTLSREDSTAVPFSNTKAAESEIRKGEEAFVRGDMDKALAAYKHALELDPRLYEAALYAGDVEFKKAHASTDAGFRNDHFEVAGVWFAKAIAIDADRETAYRYWGDALDAQGKSEEARDKFVEAIVAEPYNRRAYVGLTQWGDRHKVLLGHPRVDIPTNVTSKKPGEINITVDELALKGSADDGSAAWMMYGIVHSAWMDRKDGVRSEKFARTYPNEAAYRHSLPEEVDALRGVAESVQVQTKEKRLKKPTPSLENLMKLNDAGLIEAYVLFVRPDEGISRDYAAYRKSNRDKLKQYWLRFVVGAK
ncbi:MAG: tetratricopeptide repeat protein [Pyrinomonadaceae bacterium]